MDAFQKEKIFEFISWDMKIRFFGIFYLVAVRYKINHIGTLYCIAQTYAKKKTKIFHHCT